MSYTYKFFSDGFFGYGPEGNFKQWSLAHILPIILLIGIIVLLYIFRDKIRNWKYEENFRFIYIFIMLMVEMSYFWRLLYVGSEGQYEHLLTKLPLQVCQWTLISTCFMMAKKSPHLFSMTFFLTMSTGLIPLFVPAVISKTGPAYYRYYQFWGEHLLPIIGMYYMMFVHGFKPKPIGAGYALGMLGLLSIPAAIANANIEEASFLYLKNTDSFAMLSFLPKSLAGKLALYAVVILVLFAAVYGIYLLVIKFTSKKQTTK